MTSPQTQGRIDALAGMLQDWLRDSNRMGMNAPLPEEIAEVIKEYMKKFGVTLVSDEGWVGEAKVAALLKSGPSANSKRMRELAGIPGKGNFV